MPRILPFKVQKGLMQFYFEMERGSLKWENTDRINRIRRAHPQKHMVVAKSKWQKNKTRNRPGFFKYFQMGACQFQRDHEMNGKIQKHVCAHCITLG